MAETSDATAGQDVSHRRAGRCVKHDDLAWLYEDGSIGCMHTHIIEADYGECQWARIPRHWMATGQEIAS